MDSPNFFCFSLWVEKEDRRSLHEECSLQRQSQIERRHSCVTHYLEDLGKSGGILPYMKTLKLFDGRQEGV